MQEKGGQEERERTEENKQEHM